MRVDVLYFGVLRESFGGEGDAVVLPDGATVGELVTRVRGSRVGGVWEVLAVAVNREYAGRDVVLRDGDEVALLPPVSGGAGSFVDASADGGKKIRGSFAMLRMTAKNKAGIR